MKGRGTMFVVRSSQQVALRRAAWKSFETEMWKHWTKYFPIDVEVLGEIHGRKLIRHGIERADAHGFTKKGELCRYIDLSLSLGADYDRDPMLPWAAEILAVKQAEQAKDERMAELHGRALSYIREVFGEDGAPFRRAMVRARRITYEHAEIAAEVRPFETALRAWLDELYPQKMNALDERTWGAFFRFGCEDAEPYGMTNDAATLIHITLMFLLGSHFARDPRAWWVQDVLVNGPMSAEIKARIVLERMKGYLDRTVLVLRRRRER